MKTGKRLIAIAFVVIIISMAVATCYGQTVPAAPTSPIAATPSIFSGLSQETISDLKGFGFLLSQYVKNTGRAADLEPLWGIQTRNVLSYQGTGGIRIWPRSEEAGKWQDFLRSQNLPEPDAEKKVANQALICFADEKRSIFSADINKSANNVPTNDVLLVIFTRGFYSSEMVLVQKNVTASIASPGIDLLDSWKTDPIINGADWRNTRKNKKIELELVGRLMIMAKAFYRLNFLVANGNFAELGRCSFGKLSSKDAAVCAEFIWNFEFSSMKALSATLMTLAADKKTNSPTVYLYPPTILEFFRNERDENIAFKNYLKAILPAWYPEQAGLFPFWEKK